MDRFDVAIQKLYNAFHTDELNPECCRQCAVGNILDQSDAWRHLSDEHGSIHLNYVGTVHQRIGRRFQGYQPQELLQIEIAFLKGCGYEVPFRFNGNKPKNPTSKETLFKGLCGAVDKLCELEGIPSIMDCSTLFNYQPEPIAISA